MRGMSRQQTKKGWLKNGNPPGDFSKSPRCGAINRQGKPCQCPAMLGKRRCRLHGGKSTGARTKEGLERIRKANFIHGYRTKEWKLEKQRQIAKKLAEMEAEWSALCPPDPVRDRVRLMLGLPLRPRFKVRVVGVHNGKTYR